MANNKYDIFISYRRSTGAQYARILQLMLIQRGFKVFLDYDELKVGKFGEKIQAAIIEAPIFLLVLSQGAMERCANEDDTVKKEIMLAYKHGKVFIPVNPDKTFDGIKADVPKEIKEVAQETQYSEIEFGQALGVTVDLMIRNRIIPVVGKRTPKGEQSDDADDAKKKLSEQEKHNKFISRLAIGGTVAVLLIVLATCFAFALNQKQKDDKVALDKSRKEMMAQLNDKYRDYHLHLSDNVTVEQMEAIDDIMNNMKALYPDSIWISQFEFTIGQWHGIMGGEYPDSMKNIPITNVSYDQVYLLIDSLTDLAGIYFDLPSVDEWRYAAHGGKYHESTIYAGNDDVNKVAWYRENSGGHPHPSDGRQGMDPDSLDLFDMSGNAGELCNSPFEKGTDNVQWTVCGGNYNLPKEAVTANSKVGFGTSEKSPTVGFRIVIRKQQDI